MKKNSLVQRVLKSSFLLVYLLFLPSCDNSVQQTSQSAGGKDSGQVDSSIPSYIVAVDAAYAPLAFRDEIGRAIGFDVDILNAVSKNQGFRLTFIQTPWKGIFSTLSSGKRDIVAGGMTITEKRQEELGISDPYIEAPILVVYTDDKLGLKTFEDIKNLPVAVQVDSTFETLLKDFSSDPANVYPRKTLFLSFKSLLNGEVKAIVGDAPVLRYFMAKYANQGKSFYSFEYNPNGQPDMFGFAVKKGNDKLLNKINLGLKNIKANGEYDTIYEKWFKKK